MCIDNTRVHTLNLVLITLNDGLVDVRHPCLFAFQALSYIVMCRKVRVSHFPVFLDLGVDVNSSYKSKTGHYNISDLKSVCLHQLQTSQNQD